jgi:Trypsin
MARGNTFWRAAMGVLFLLALSCRTSHPSSVAAEDLDLIGGQAAPFNELTSVVRIDEGCTATQIAPRLLLTASHCIRTALGAVSPSFAAGRLLTIESRDQRGTLRLVKLTIESAAIHPRLTEVCASENNGRGCTDSSAAAKRDAPDLATIKLAQPIPNSTVTPISVSAAKPDERIQVAGFGCTVRVGGSTDDVLRAGTTRALEEGEASHSGAGMTIDESKALASVYLYTEGPALRSGSSVVGLCPGDSGGPAFRNADLGGLALVGVNASYTFMFPAGTTAGIPAVNWHARVDVFARYEVFSWLEKQGATFTR